MNPTRPLCHARTTADDATALGVDVVVYADLPDWWLRLTAPVALSWKREVAALLLLELAGFAAGLLVGVQLAG